MKVYVQLIPERLEYLLATLWNQAERIGEVEPFMDYRHTGNLWNAERIWREVGRAGEVALIVQDDSIIHDDLAHYMPRLAHYITTGRVPLIALYAPPNPAAKQAMEKGANFYARYPFPRVHGVVISPDFAARLADFAAAIRKELPRIGDDSALSHFMSSTGERFWTTVPSLVQHNAEIPSFMRHGGDMSEMWGNIEPGWFDEPRVT